MFHLRAVGAFALFQATRTMAQDTGSQVQIVNLINPLWALPNGKNSTNGLGASVVNVDSTATTYAVSCDATAELVPGPTPISCIWETIGPQVFTQWDTSLEFKISATGFGDVATYEGHYTFPSTLAPTITGSFSLNIASSQTTLRHGERDVVPATTSTSIQTGTAEATWYRIPITAGEEKLLAVLSSSTRTLTSGEPTSTSGSTTTDSQGTTTSSSTRSGETSGSLSLSSGSGTNTASPTVTSTTPTGSTATGGEAAATIPNTSSSTAAAAAEKVGGKVGWIGALVGGVLGVFVL